jgi:hypothetical protein
MKLGFFILSAFIGALFALPALAVTFESDIQQGFIKKNSIVTEHFRLEFSDLIEGQTDSDGDGIADVIELLAETAELSWDVFIDDMGYPEINQDSDRRTAIILDDFDTYLSSGALGITSVLSNGDPYVAIDPFLSDDLLRVTMAHEFFHVIQFDIGIGFAYTDQGINLAESTATWSEDEVYDDINDYVSYLDDYFEYPDFSVFAAYVPSGTLYEYAMSIWPRYLSEQFDEDIVLEIWEEYQDTSIDYYDMASLYEVVGEVIDNNGGSLDEAYADFALWNLDLDFYEEGDLYPDVFLLDDLVMEELTLIDESYAPALYGSNYLYFENDGSSDGFYFQLVKPDGVEFAVTLVPVDGNDYLGEEAVRVYVDEYEEMEDTIAISDLNGYDAVVAIVSALDADFDEISDPELIFDEGYLYYYYAQYGDAPDVDTEEVEVEETGDKDSEEPAQNNDVRITDQLVLNIRSYNEDSATLSWNRPDTDITLYDIWYVDSNEEWFVKTIDQGYITSSIISDLEEGETYTFEIYAYDDDELQVGEVSNDLTITTEEWLFTDLSFLDGHYDAISSLVEMEIFEGYPDGSFDADGVINRAELLKILIEARGIDPDENAYKNCFPDVREDWYAKYVCYAKEQNWIAGYPDGTYRPGDTVNKVEALKILFNVYEEGLTEGATVSRLSYPDLDTHAWYAIYVWKASSLGILEEVPGDDFSPSDGRLRGDMAEELYRYLIQLSRS